LLDLELIPVPGAELDARAAIADLRPRSFEGGHGIVCSGDGQPNLDLPISGPRGGCHPEEAAIATEGRGFDGFAPPVHA
jgi:hypothetical protein